MIRYIALILLLGVTSIRLYGQLTIYQDETGQILTKIDSYASDVKNASGLVSPHHTQVIYAGSPFLNFPIWQPATMRLDEHGQDMTCELAYNVVTNEVLCRFAGDPVVSIITPAIFTIGNETYVRQINKLVGLNHYSYFKTLHSGPTTLLASLSKRLKANYSGDSGYDKELAYAGSYQTTTNYYVRKGNALPEPLGLSKKSLSQVLYEQGEQIAARLPDKQLTTQQVVQVLTYYDSLMAVANVNKLPLRKDPLFNQALHDKINYPILAWRQGVYGRVYVGFDITEQGNVKNATLLSPENVGFGFAETVINALSKLPALDPAFRGKYALPVTFTYTNAREKTGPHVPVNQLPADRLGKHVLLDEFVVPIVVDKPIADSREVWGYYR